MRLGIDVGSTTVKLVLLDENGTMLYQRYERHMSSVFSKVSELLEQLKAEKGDLTVKAVITGSRRAFARGQNRSEIRAGGCNLFISSRKIDTADRCCH